jgi:DnaJ-domain-containing protein 1
MNDASRIFGILHRYARGDRAPRKPEPAAQKCQWPKCPSDAANELPADPKRPGRTLWLCREHAREHNAGWDYFAGMDRQEIEQFRREDVTGHRPTWKLGSISGKGWRDPRFVNGWPDFGVPPRGRPGTAFAGAAAKNNGPVRDAMSIFRLDATATWSEVRSRYKELVKRHHPDANGGCKKAESKLKRINQAYGLLKASYGE